MAINTSLLKEIGMTEGEIKVYLALIQLGSSSTGKIIKESKVHASKVYPILDRLVEKGVVSYIKEGKKSVFSSNPPSTIISYLEKKEKEIESQKIEAKKLVEQIELQKKMTLTQSEATIFRGLRGFEVALNSFISRCKTEHPVNIVGVAEFKPSFRRRFLDSLAAIYEARIIIDEENLNKYDFPKNAAVKIVPKGNTIPSLIFTSNDLVLISVNQGDTTFLIQNLEMANSFASYFNYFWYSKTRTYMGDAATQIAFNEMIETSIKEKSLINFGVSTRLFRTKLPKKMMEFMETYKKHKFDLRTILSNSDKQETTIAKVKYLPKGFIPPVKILISGEKVFMADFEEPITVIIIEKKEIAESYKEHFEALWKIAKD